MSRRSSGAILLFALLAWGCRSSGPAITPLAAADASEAWQRLVHLRDSTLALESSSRIRFFDGQRRRSFSARIATGEGRMALTAFTPIGSAAFGFFADGERVLFLDHVHSAYWRGTFVDLAGRLRLPAEEVAAGDLGRLLLGLPAGGAGTPCGGAQDGCVENGLARYQIDRGGLLRAELAGATFTYEGGFPPARVVVEGGGRRLEIDHHELRSASDAPAEPALDGYRCCLDPRIDSDGR